MYWINTEILPTFLVIFISLWLFCLDWKVPGPRRIFGVKLVFLTTQQPRKERLILALTNRIFTDVRLI